MKSIEQIASEMMNPDASNFMPAQDADQNSASSTKSRSGSFKWNVHPQQRMQMSMAIDTINRKPRSEYNIQNPQPIFPFPQMNMATATINPYAIQISNPPFLYSQQRMAADTYNKRPESQYRSQNSQPILTSQQQSMAAVNLSEYDARRKSHGNPFRTQQFALATPQSIMAVDNLSGQNPHQPRHRNPFKTQQPDLSTSQSAMAIGNLSDQDYHQTSHTNPYKTQQSEVSTSQSVMAIGNLCEAQDALPAHRSSLYGSPKALSQNFQYGPSSLSQMQMQLLMEEGASDGSEKGLYPDFQYNHHNFQQGQAQHATSNLNFRYDAYGLRRRQNRQAVAAFKMTKHGPLRSSTYSTELEQPSERRQDQIDTNPLTTPQYWGATEQSTKPPQNQPYNTLPFPPAPHMGILYDKIPEGQTLRSIRLLRLLRPPTVGHPMSFALHTFEFSSCPSYIAVSYAWGNDTPELTICVNGLEVITRHNLFVFLKQFCNFVRNTDYLWIDAICIDQSNNAEKSHVVKHMGEIYKSARSVLAWLGEALPSDQPGTDNCLIRQLHAVGELFWNEVPEGERRYSPTMMEDIVKRCLGKISPMFDSRKETAFRVSAFMELCLKEYWTRTWVLQEVHLGSKYNKVHFHIGEEGIDLRALAGAVMLLQAFRKYVISSMPNIESGSQVILDRFLELHPFPQMHRLILYTSIYPPDVGSLKIAMTNFCVKDDTQAARASDPRDVIYGLLGFAAEEEKQLIVPNYDLDVKATYQEITKAFLASGWTDILSWAQGPNKEIQGLPSWVPDYSATIHQPICSKSQAKDWLPRFSVTGNSILDKRDEAGTPTTITLAGFNIGTVKTVGKLSAVSSQDHKLKDSKSVPHKQVLEFLEEVQSLCELAKQLAIHNPLGFLQTAMEDAELNVPIAGQLFQNSDFIRNHPELPRMHRSALDSLKQNVMDGTPVPAEARPFIESLLLHVERRVFVTENGYMGLGPSWMRQGDEVVAFYGFNAPYVIRPSDYGDCLVGEAYVHGVMDGQLMGTPLEKKKKVTLV